MCQKKCRNVQNQPGDIFWEQIIFKMTLGPTFAKSTNICLIGVLFLMGYSLMKIPPLWGILNERMFAASGEHTFFFCSVHWGF